MKGLSLRSVLTVLMPMLGIVMAPGFGPSVLGPALAEETPSFDGLEAQRRNSTPELPSWFSRYSPTVVFLGDSLTEGPGLRPSEPYPALIQKMLDAAGLPLEAVNAGVGGNTSTQGLARIDWWLAKKPLFLVINFGTNDANGSKTAPAVTAEWLRRNLDQMVARAHAQNTWVVLIPTKLPSFYDPALVAGFSAAFQSVSRARRVPLGPGLLDGVWGNKLLWQRDGHPNAAGHRLMARNVWKALEPVIKRRLRR
ncbi:MAG: arylesterase [Candidatus Riflebacteria bacterium]|nr:arylesterase [Candidatus Riflebacteria bacterium]